MCLGYSVNTIKTTDPIFIIISPGLHMVQRHGEFEFYMPVCSSFKTFPELAGILYRYV